MNGKENNGNRPHKTPDPLQHFAPCPDAFLQGLSPDQYKTLKDTYATAMEAARRQVTQPKPFVPPFEFEEAGGI